MCLGQREITRFIYTKWLANRLCTKKKEKKRSLFMHTLIPSGSPHSCEESMQTMLLKINIVRYRTYLKHRVHWFTQPWPFPSLFSLCRSEGYYCVVFNTFYSSYLALVYVLATCQPRLLTYVGFRIHIANDVFVELRVEVLTCKC